MPKTAAFDFRKPRQVVAKIAGLLRAPRRVVLRIEVQDNRPPGMVRQPVRLAVLIFQRKRRRLLPWLNHLFTPRPFPLTPIREGSKRRIVCEKMETFVPSLTAEPRRRWEFSLLGKKTLPSSRRCGETEILGGARETHESVCWLLPCWRWCPTPSARLSFSRTSTSFPMDRERVLERQTVVVRDGRIAHDRRRGAGSTAPAGATRVDGTRANI